MTRSVTTPGPFRFPGRLTCGRLCWNEPRLDRRTSVANRLRTLVFLLGWLAFAQPIFAQTNNPSEPIRVAGWTISGSIRLRFEDWDFFKAQSGDSRYGFGASLLRVSVARQFRTHDWLFELEQPSLIGLPTQAIAPVPQGQLGFGGTYRAANPDRVVGIFLKQGFIRFKGLGGDQSNTLRFGRFEYGDGLELNPEGPLGAVVRDRVANRLIGNFGFTHVMRSLDGIHFSRGASTGNFTFLAVRPTEGVFQVKGTKELNIDLVYGAWSKIHRSVGEGEGRIFATYYRDGRDVLKTDNRPLPLRAQDHKNINIATVGGNYVNVFDLGRGKADVLVWVALQTGNWGTLAHRANAVAAEGGYRLSNIQLKPWFRGGYFRGSGDDGPSGRIHGTFFQELPMLRT